MTMIDLDTSTRIVLLASGLMFTWALSLGTVKYAQMRHSPAAQAHPYIDIAHRAALLYAFAIGLIAVFVQLSAWPAWLNLTAALAQIVFFATAVISYHIHGILRDTDNQFRGAPRAMGWFMLALIIAEIGGFAILLLGFAWAWICGSPAR